MKQIQAHVFHKQTFLSRCLWALLWVLPLAISDVQAQMPNLLIQSTSVGIGNYSVSQSTAVDAMDNIYITGYFTGSVTWGTTTLVSQGDQDIFLAKYDANGTFLWAKRAGGTNQDRGNSIAVSGSAVYITGYFEHTANFNTPSATGSNELSSAGNTDMFLAKYDTNGTFQWAKRMGGTSYDMGEGVAVSGNEVYITGSFHNTVNFNTPSATGSNELSSAGSTDIFLAKYDANGAFQWAKRAGGTNAESGSGVAVSGSNVYITGNFYVAANFNTPSATGSNELTSAGYQDIFLAKYDANGTFQWAKRAGGISADYGYSVAVSGSAVYITGVFSKYANFNTPSVSGSNELISGDDYDIFLAKYDANGAFQWAKRTGGNAVEDHCKSVSVSGSKVYITGSFQNTTNFNTPSATGYNELTSAGDRDIFLAEYNTDGAFQWAKRAGGTGYDLGTSIGVLSSSVYITGAFAGTANFNTPSASGSNELTSPNLNSFIARYTQSNCEVTTNQSRTIRQGTSLLVHNRSYNVSGIYRDTIFRVGVCDSIIVTNLTVMTCNVTVSIGTNGNTLTANALGGQGGYTFLWNNQATTSTLNNAVAGTTYQVTVTDVLGCTATATLVFAAPTPTASNNDLTFDGINDYVNLGNITELNNASAFTFEAMIYSTSTSDNRNLFSKRVSNSDNIQIQYNDGRFIISIGGGALGTAYGGIGAAGLPLHTWFHLAVVYDGTGATNSDKVKLYVNAIPRTLSFTGTVQSVTTSNTAACYLGAETNYPTALTAFQGKMNDVRIWNTARTAAQLMASNNVCLTNSTGLIAHYKLDETSGNTAASTTGNYNGTLHNFVGNPWNASTSGCAAATPVPTQSLYQLQVTGADCRNTQPATLQINMNATRTCIDALTLRVRFDTTQIFFDHPMTIQKGAAIPASGVVLYHLRRDTLILSVDLDAGCIQGTSGTNVLSIPFRLRPSFAVSNASSLFRLTVSEERVTTITTHDSTSQIFQVSPILIGNVSVVRPNGSAVQGTTLPVTLLVGDSCNRLTRTIVADTNSKTMVRLDSFHFVRFQRPALPVVASPLIGGYDVFLVRAYLHGDTVLTARQKIAADVNNDGAITALDVTILRRRALGIYTNFADYSGGRLTSDYQFTVSPNLDHPSVCIGLPPLSTICDTPSVQVTMITLGDLNGDTDTNPSGRIERETEPIAKQNSKVTFNLHHATRVADEWKIPVYANQVTRGLDLQLLNLSLNPNVFRVAAAHSNFEVLGNGNGSNYYIVGNANTLQGIPANDTLFYLYMKTNPKACQQLGQLNGYLDAQRILTDCLTAVTGTAELEPNSVEMYPNPTEGNVQMTIQQPLSNPTTLRIYDMLGRCVRTQVLQSGNRHFTIDISDLAQGIYQFQFENQAKKLVKQ